MRRRSRKEDGERVFRPWRRSVEIPCQIERRVLRACKKGEEDKEGRQPKKEVAWRGQARRVDSEGWRETSEREDRGRVLWIRACFEMERKWASGSGRGFWSEAPGVKCREGVTSLETYSSRFGAAMESDKRVRTRGGILMNTGPRIFGGPKASSWSNNIAKKTGGNGRRGSTMGVHGPDKAGSMAGRS